MAIEVMAESGIDVRGQRSKSVDEFLGAGFDSIVTTCDDAKEGCPVFTGQGEGLHWGLEDPAQAGGPREEKLKVFRRVRDELEDLIRFHFVSDSRESWSFNKNPRSGPFRIKTPGFGGKGKENG